MNSVEPLRSSVRLQRRHIFKKKIRLDSNATFRKITEVNDVIDRKWKQSVFELKQGESIEPPLPVGPGPHTVTWNYRRQWRENDRTGKCFGFFTSMKNDEEKKSFKATNK